MAGCQPAILRSHFTKTPTSKKTQAREKRRQRYLAKRVEISAKLKTGRATATESSQPASSQAEHNAISRARYAANPEPKKMASRVRYAAYSETIKADKLCRYTANSELIKASQ